MVTWTFDLIALLVGFFVGIFAGAFVVIFDEMRDGGSWSKGFNDGCKLKYSIERLEKIMEDARKDD